MTQSHQASETVLFSAMLAAATLYIPISIDAQTLQDTPWSFGLIGDTQWTLGNDTANPEGVAAAIIRQINEQFIAKGVKLVIQPGDLSDNGGREPLRVRADAAELLYSAGIGFFPVRGNHDYNWYYSSSYGINGFHEAFPQTFGEQQNLVDLYGAKNFSSPPPLGDDYDTVLNGMSYSFDYGTGKSSARFLVVDVLGTKSKHSSSHLTAGIRFGYSIGEQQEWISERLDKSTRGTTHAFVFAHQNLIGENHSDCIFSGYADTLPDMQNAFFASLQDNDVKYFIGAHDHLFNRSIITSPDGQSRVENTILSGASTKFYPPNDTADIGFRGQKSRQLPIAQEIKNIGFTIYTVDGPSVTVDYYSDTTGNFYSDGAWPDGDGPLPNGVTPTLTFARKMTWGYSLNGKEFLIPQGTSYTSISDRFQGTSLAILDGVNRSTSMDHEGRLLTKSVTTGWKTKNDDSLRSNILTIWGMSDFGTDTTDIYVIELNYDPRMVGSCALMTKNSDGVWSHTVNDNTGGARRFVAGPYKSTYSLGTYGIDLAKKTVWAVINHAGTFAAHASVDGDQDGDNDIDNNDVGKVLFHRNKAAHVCPSADLDNDGLITMNDVRKLVLLKTVQR